MAYYSKLQPTIYHECRNCNVGNNMVKENLGKGMPPPIKGRGGKIKDPKLCRTCARLEADNKCIPGIPDLPEPFGGDVVETYYSKESPETFHMCQNCYLGQNIEKKNLIANQPPRVKNGKKPKLCSVCVRLCVEGKCITGAPIPADKIKSPYYSKAHTPPEVFHACNDCYVGTMIDPANKAAGRPEEARLCRICYRMLKEGRC